MFQKNTEILKKISSLILLVENSRIEKISKFKIVKVLLAVKLKLFELLKKEIELEAKTNDAAEAANRGIGGDLKKHELILQFIKNNGGRVDTVKLLTLGIASRSLRRYIKNLRDENKIKIEKSGRNLFYLMV